MATATDGRNFPYCLGDENIDPTTANAIYSHLMEIASIRHMPARDNRNSVLAFVRFPEDTRPGCACDGARWEDVRIRMSYDKLMALGSTKIQEMLSPSAQRRFRRRLRLETLPPGIEYVVDFTPPSEGPELADLTAALWLPKIVKLWFLAGQYVPNPVLERRDGISRRPLADKAVGSIMTLGHDDVCKSKACFADLAPWQTKDEVPGIVEEHPADPRTRIPAFRKIDDYCPIRHRVSIVRLLRAINGDNLLLNSAVRMWTVAQVAIYLEVPQVVVDPVTQWLVAPPNTKFIEICPERAFQLAYALKIPSVLIAAFRILVNERAVDYAGSAPSPHLPEWTWVQRRRDEYGDFPSDPVEYASRAFAERMSDKVRMLQSDKVFEWLPIMNKEWELLSLLSTHNASGPVKEACENLSSALLAAFHNHVKCIAASSNFHTPTLEFIEAQRQHYVPSWEHRTLNSLYHDLNSFQKALTPFFWDSLRSQFPTYSQFLVFKTHPEGKSLIQLAMTLNQHLRTTTGKTSAVPIESPDADESPLLIGIDSERDQEDQVFSLRAFYDTLKQALAMLCASVQGAHLRGGGSLPGEYEGGIPYFLSDHLLLSLDEKELNYLPIWADGLDDGSGGVFQDVIPPAEMGPSEPGPGYHTGITLPSVADRTDGDADTEIVSRGYASTISPSMTRGLDVLALDDNETLARSMDAHRSGTATTVAGGGGHGARPPASLSESFTADYDEEAGAGGVYGEARFAQPADHQVQGMAIERYVEEESQGDEAIAMQIDGDDDMLDFAVSDDGSSTLDGFEEIEAP
ncbi:hypothetical protein MMYC01_204828 [Madurella mycetomatis]|uniref:Uncharacterized protein n=1 Tax=Madurella mycetomatis TaxID=100816 RepID=A0A175W696_9PEZI|nr:hypothetical protein MMYC01_207251 [Madurella mycetomatis]KXX79173.1 hypothetical protein MMYC01_204828 [Madurella mycetomatis]